MLVIQLPVWSLLLFLFLAQTDLLHRLKRDDNTVEAGCDSYMRGPDYSGTNSLPTDSASEEARQKTLKYGMSQNKQNCRKNEKNREEEKEYHRQGRAKRTLNKTTSTSSIFQSTDAEKSRDRTSGSPLLHMPPRVGSRFRGECDARHTDQDPSGFSEYFCRVHCKARPPAICHRKGNRSSHITTHIQR